MPYKKLLLASVAAVALASAADAGSILIINGASGTSEPGTTSSITTNLSNLHMAVGNTVTVADGLPVSLGAYDQVWDIRFSNAWAITASEQASYLSYLQGGGGMFVMGENSGFMSRNNSIFSLISAAGGGNLSFTSGSSTQDVYAPFDGPNAVSQVTYLAPGWVDGNGSGDWITESGGTGTGVAWGVGDLANATAGALTTIFDVNFMELNAAESSQNLTKNLIGFIEDEVTPEVPLPATLPLALAGFAAFGVVRRRKKA